MRRAYVSSSVPALLLLVVAALAVVGCASKSEQAALELAGRALGGDASYADLEYRREVKDGFVWRFAPTPLSSAVNLSRATHLDVIACTAGDRATEAVRFSFLHWEPEGCEGGRARLRRVQRTPEQDARRLGDFIAPPRGVDGDPALNRVRG